MARAGGIEAVEELAGLSDEQAIAKAHALSPNENRNSKASSCGIARVCSFSIPSQQRQIPSLSGRFVEACREQSRPFVPLICLARRRSRHKAAAIPAGSIRQSAVHLDTASLRP